LLARLSKIQFVWIMAGGVGMDSAAV